MGGKASILLVLAFSTIFLVVGFNIARFSVDSTGNVVDYQTKTELNAYVKSINQYALQQVINALNTQNFQANKTGTFKAKFMNYDFDVQTVQEIHPSVGVVFRIKTAVKGENYSYKYNKSTDIFIRRRNLQDYAYFSSNEGGNIWFTTGDVITGKFYVNDVLRVKGKPVFYEEVAHKGTVSYYDNTTNPDFKKGHVQKEIQFPEVQNITQFQAKANSGGLLIKNQPNVYIRFENEKVRIKYSSSTSWTHSSVIVKNISEIAPNGCIFAEKAAVYVEGKVKGNVSLGASGTNTNSQGTIFISDNLTYADSANFYLNPNSSNKNALGLIAEQDVYIQDNTANRSGDIDIHAMIYAQKGGFGVQNYSSFPKNVGKIKLRGGIIQNIRRAVGQLSGTSDILGYFKDYVYDTRMKDAIQLPFFPVLNSYSSFARNEGMVKTLK